MKIKKTIWISLITLLYLHDVTECKVPTGVDKPTTTTMVTSFQDKMNAINKAIRAKYTFRYNPNLGYEPYWISGEFYVTNPWIALSNQGVTTTTHSVVCGQTCHPIYRSIKEVCGHFTGEVESTGCATYYYYNHCTGRPPLQLLDPYKTFDSYCAFLAFNCKVLFSADRYIFMHIGKCKPIDEWFKPMFYYSELASRLSSYPLVDMSTRSTTTTSTTPSTTKAAG